MGLVEQIWERLDERIDSIKDKDSSPMIVEEAKSQAAAYADVLTLFMAPLYNTVTDISREALKRYKARQAGDLDYETPGIAHAKYKTMMDGEVWYRTEEGWTDDPMQATGAAALGDDAILNRAHGIMAIAMEAKPLRVGGRLPLKSTEEVQNSKAVKHNFTEEEVQKIKTFAANGFAPEDLARIHGVSVAVIRSALAS